MHGARRPTQVNFEIDHQCDSGVLKKERLKSKLCQPCETTPRNVTCSQCSHTRSHTSPSHRDIFRHIFFQITEMDTSCCSSPRNNQVDILLKKIFTLFQTLFSFFTFFTPSCCVLNRYTIHARMQKLPCAFINLTSLGGTILSTHAKLTNYFYQVNFISIRAHLVFNFVTAYLIFSLFNHNFKQQNTLKDIIFKYVMYMFFIYHILLIKKGKFPLSV